MVKMEHSSRKGLFKMFEEADVDAAKKLGWKEVGTKAAKKIKKKKKVKK
tara:strand:+ start:174 stop:320 length:147 start_codon:yes stop_codon:yes gene_type:complete